MNNLFDFNFETVQLLNKDSEQSESRFSVVYGQNGQIVHTKKDSYKIVPTQEFSLIGNAFMDKGYNVKPFVQRHGEVIGFDIDFGGSSARIGEKKINAIITLPNNGNGVGRLSIKEVRLVCTNGMTRTSTKSIRGIKIPHNLGYSHSIKLMAEGLEVFESLVSQANQMDEKLNEVELTREEAMYRINEWFYHKEIPSSQKPETLDQFRRDLATLPTDEMKYYPRYEQLKDAFNRELMYNQTLDLKVSHYTILATANNYLSRRIEASNSSAPRVVQYERQSKKVADLLEVNA